MTIEERVRSTLQEAGSRISVREVPAGHAVPTAAPRRSIGLSPIVAFAGGLVAVLLLGFAFFLGRGGETPPAQEPPPPLEDIDPASIDWRALDVLPTDFMVQEIVTGPAGWIALTDRFRGVVGSPSDLLMRSENGVDWSELESGGFPSAVNIRGLVGHEDGYLAHGLYAGPEYTVTTRDRPSNFAEPAVWTSVDAMTWELTPLPLPPPSEAISEVVSYMITDVAIDDQGAVVVGVEFDEDLPEVEGEQIVPTRPITWSTDEAGDWVLVDDTPIEGALALTSGRLGVLAALPGDGEISIWARGADKSWFEIGVIPAEDMLLNLTGNSDGYMAQTAQGVWLSPDGAEWALNSSLGQVVTIGTGSQGFAVVTRSAEGSAAVWLIRDMSHFIGAGLNEGIDVAVDYLGGAAVTDHAVLIYGQSGSGMADPDSVEAFLLVGTGER